MTTAVECKLIREGGTRAEVHGTEYHFEPYTCGAHVAQIADSDHADVFLSIAEGYRLYRGNGKPVGAAKPANSGELKPSNSAELESPAAAPAEPKAQEHFAPLGSDAFPESFEIGGVTHSLNSVVSKAFAASGMSLTTWNQLDQEARNVAIEQALDDLAAAAPQEEAKQEAPAGDDINTLRAEYERLYGKKPHHNTGIEKLREAIAAKQ